MFDPHAAPHGSAEFTDFRGRKDAGLYGRFGAFIGADAAGRECRSSQQSALCLVGGARSGKGNFGLKWLIDASMGDEDGPHHIINLDFKSQDTPVASLQVVQGRHHYCYNPRGRGGLHSSKINPYAHLIAASPTLVPDAFLSSASWIPFTDPKAQYFEGMAQTINTAVLVTLVRANGSVTVPEVAEKIAALGDTSEEWLSFEFEISQQPEPEINQVAADLRKLREGNSDAGGFAGIKNELARRYACMMDPQVREALSPPFDFCFSQLCEGNSHPTMVSIMEDLEYAENNSVVKALFTCALVFKRRAVSARPQFWLLNEVAAMGAWPLAESLATISAGYNIRTAYVVQSTEQFERLKKGASNVIPNSCGTIIYMGIRSVQQASLVSRQLGRQTLHYDDFVQQERARAAKSKAMADLIFGHGNPVQAIMTAQHQDRLANHKSKMARDLRTIDEVINEANERAYVFMPGVLERPFYAFVPQYWRSKSNAGRYNRDPFHSKPGRVEVATWLGQSNRKIITEPAPSRYADWPQYRDSGLWSYVRGYRP
ncbi:type IV secretory system conjugative DNA transfer family protein [uncultured Roseobacter sp.]|uniref:type IV secretory system conjugative DNA transfer family protein n=1 Tax=uncultured Roseobacter sp. TaxID=114847 RepID=UPI0026071669|nr:type IV secretory system conjugative DNA transfer family protein [uncultured Roseobacter sp.]